MSHTFIIVIIITIIICGAEAVSVPSVPAKPDVWYTQIGQWHLQQSTKKSTLHSTQCDDSFLAFDNILDSARSGQATANVRLNKTIHDIKSITSRLALGPAPSTAGLLVQNKEVTYYFLLSRGANIDSLQIFRTCGNRMFFLAGSCINISDTSNLFLTAHTDSLVLRTDTFKLCIALPVDFSQLTAIGFECPKGSVKVFTACIESRDVSVNELFDTATLINLHLDRMFKK